MNVSPPTRDSIRADMRAKRKAMDDASLHEHANALLNHLKPIIRDASSVAGYQAMQGEMLIDPVFAYCWDNDVDTLLPIMTQQSLMFAKFDSNTEFVEKQYGIKEPEVPADSLLQPEQLHIVLLPLVAFDNHGNRIGMGGGFYDRSFAFIKNKRANSSPDKPLLVGVAHAFQEVQDAMPESWDVPLDCIATDKGLIELTQ